MQELKEEETARALERTTNINGAGTVWYGANMMTEGRRLRYVSEVAETSYLAICETTTG